MTIMAYAERIINGGELVFHEARALLDSEKTAELEACAKNVFSAFHDAQADVCSLVNARSGRCSEDCAFCAQSGHHHTGVTEYPLVSIEDIVARAHVAEKEGVGRFCIVTSGGELSPEDFSQVIAAYRRIRRMNGYGLLRK
jgi:biotin synthase